MFTDSAEEAEWTAVRKDCSSADDSDGGGSSSSAVEGERRISVFRCKSISPLVSVKK